MAAVKRNPAPFSLLGHSGPLKAQQMLGEGLCWLYGAAGTPFAPTPQFHTKPCRCSRRVVSIDERIDLGCASNLIGVLIKLTATSNWKRVLICLKHSFL